MSYAECERGRMSATKKTALLGNTINLRFTDLGSIVPFNQIGKYRTSHGDCVLPDDRGFRDETKEVPATKSDI
ncbi:hypothetical protein T07_5586 [Trichinella nelsoni]|uniref:Uncharacterized protein n=1 Tax=Trichinella nelsoni TaxID=6336 RepID=A0A0V0S1S4_9BILA|nr:hypothetical protein T07_5586 [Trichinella nelsoni]